MITLDRVRGFILWKDQLEERFCLIKKSARIADAFRITKKMTFQTSRHTFATTVTLSKLCSD